MYPIPRTRWPARRRLQGCVFTHPGHGEQTVAVLPSSHRGCSGGLRSSSPSTPRLLASEGEQGGLQGSPPERSWWSPGAGSSCLLFRWQLSRPVWSRLEGFLGTRCHGKRLWRAQREQLAFRGQRRVRVSYHVVGLPGQVSEGLSAGKRRNRPTSNPNAERIVPVRGERSTETSFWHRQALRGKSWPAELAGGGMSWRSFKALFL